jgi:AcrR family transcriptional regulator
VSAVKRGYDMTRRRAQAEATRQDVLDAAGRLFVAKGYAASTVDEIAAGAGVSRETVFKAVGTKRQLLRLWVEREVAGADEPVPIRQQDWVRVVRDTPDQRRRVEVAVAAACRIQDRAGHAIDVLRAAAQADPDIAALWDTACSQRRDDVRAITDLLTDSGADHRNKEVVDVMYALTSSEMYDLFVRDCGWQRDRFERWLVDAILQLALGQARH